MKTFDDIQINRPQLAVSYLALLKITGNYQIEDKLFAEFIIQYQSKDGRC